ncbi:MAG: caspase family protein [Gemmataceae bacterium]
MARRALLCGINNYKSVRDLRGCVRDVENFRSLLTAQYGFASEDVHILTDRDVVKSKLKAAWKWLLKGAGPGDTLVFHFSGHGSYVPDRNGDEDDGRDEILCLYDMDFNSDKTYLLDDELGAWIDETPEGANLIVVTDCCHSGSNTRMVTDAVGGRVVRFVLDEDATFRVARATGASPKDVEVLARFLPPPAWVPALDAAPRPASRAASPRPNHHLHLAACQDSETASDAPIDGQYAGAFTHHLCRLLRGEPGLGSAELEPKLVTALTEFAQRPRVNGSPRPGPLFGGAARPAGPVAAATGLTEATGRALLTAITDLTAALRQPVSRTRSAGKRMLVYVHGIDEHPGDFSGPWWEALRPHVGTTFGDGNLNDTRFGVHWSDIVNPRALAGVRPVAADEEVVRTMIAREIEERVAAEAGPRRGAAPAPPDTRGAAPQLDDFVRYMFQSSIRARVLDRFTAVVRPLLADGDTLDIVSHSWGTVVAFEGLVQLESEGLPGRVANLFTAGAALSIGAVRWKLGLGGRRPAQVGRWVNVDAKGDSVGGALAGNYPVDFDYTDVEPTGCTRGWFGYNLSCAHGSYFNPDNLTVNRDIFARHIAQG